MAKVVKQGPMGRANCIEFWYSEVETCNEFPIGRERGRPPRDGAAPSYDGRVLVPGHVMGVWR